MRLEEYPGRLRYDYDYGNQKIISFPNAYAVHDSTARFFREIMTSTMNPSLTLGSCGSIGGHRSQTTTLTSNGRKSHAKGADEAHYVRSGELDTIPLFPAFVIEGLFRNRRRPTRRCDPLAVLIQRAYPCGTRS